MLSPFRVPLDGSYVVSEDFFSNVDLISLKQNSGSHLWIIDNAFYVDMKESLQVCLEKSWPADFVYGVISDKYPGKLYATTKNLAGQSSKFKSALQNAHSQKFFYGEFRSSISWIDFYIVNFVGKFLKILKR